MDNTKPAEDIIPLRPSLQTFDTDSDVELKNKGLEEVVLSYFNADDFVKVINILEYTFYWQSFDPKDEKIDVIFHYNVQMTSTSRGEPKINEIGPKEIRILRGWDAVRMIVDMIKYIRVRDAQIAKRGMPGVKTISASWANNTNNKKIIEKIFLGVVTPTFIESELVSKDTVVKTSDPDEQAIIDKIQNEQLKDLPKFDNFKTVDSLAKELGIDINGVNQN